MRRYGRLRQSDTANQLTGRKLALAVQQPQDLQPRRITKAAEVLRHKLATARCVD